MSESELVLTSEERECLVKVLQSSLTELRREEHRTRTPLFREHVLRQEQLLLSILSKLGVSGT